MEIEEIKNLWASQPIEKKSKEVLAEMLKIKSHPVLKKIKTQLLLEMIAWLILLAVYYTMFDGEKRPWFINFVFVLGLLQAVTYNLSGYLAARNLIQGDNLSISFINYLRQLKKFRSSAIGSRLLLMTGLLLFFSYGHELNSKRIIAMLSISSIFILQLWLLYQQWTKRIGKLEAISKSFGAG